MIFMFTEICITLAKIIFAKIMIFYRKTEQPKMTKYGETVSAKKFTENFRHFRPKALLVAHWAPVLHHFLDGPLLGMCIGKVFQASVKNMCAVSVPSLTMIRTV